MPSPIMIIEDVDADFEAVRRSLERLEVPNPLVRCTDVEEALAYLYEQHAPADREAAPPVPNIILLDLHLEDSHGSELLRRLKKDDYLRTIPIIVWSASQNPRDIEICYRLGANSYVHKTFDFSEINRTLESLKTFWLETAVLPPSTHGPS